MSAPVITTQPSPMTATAGANATFTAAASGAVSADLYRGSGGGGVYYGSNATGSGGTVSVTISTVSSSDQGNYFFAFRNAAWSSTHSASDTTLTSTAMLTVVGSGTNGPSTGTSPPTITGQPSSDTTNVGYQKMFSVIASGGTLTYQWYFNGAAISGATSANYTISSVTTANAGNYYVIVSNSTGTQQSATVTLTVNSYGGSTGTGGTGGNGTIALSVGPLATYVGDAFVLAGAFLDQYEPVPAKSEWGMDMLVRLVRGTAPNVVSYSASLLQGQIFVCNGTPYYLQSWEPDNQPIFPGFTLHYKGLIGGIPQPKADGQSIEQSFTAVATFASGASLAGYTSATRDIRYVTRSAKTRYITTSRPTAPSYGLDVDPGITIIYSVIQATRADGSVKTFSGSGADADLVAALTPAAAVLSFMECTSVVGSPYFECTDSGSKLYQGS